MTKCPIIIGLTGSIGMGKSATLRLFASAGCAVFDADKVVHDLLSKGGKAVAKTAKLFPQALKNGAIDRKTVGREIFFYPAKLKILEAILHPLVMAEERRATKEAKAQKAAFLVLDIPLLFETKSDRRCDATVCVWAPARIQKERVLKRSGMTAEKLKALLSCQMKSADKKKRANFSIRTDKGFAYARRQVQSVLNRLRRDF
jgi:dephospho-CoA kinase